MAVKAVAARKIESPQAGAAALAVPERPGSQDVVHREELPETQATVPVAV